MFITLDQIKIALEFLEKYHIFFGTNFLSFKKGNIPVGDKINFPIDTELRKFMNEHYKPKKSSTYYYRPMRSVRKKEKWVTSKFPGGTAQKTRTTGDFAKAFIHETGTQLWGWQKDYMKILQTKLGVHERLPMFSLAVWLYREKNLDQNTTPKDVVAAFVQEFQITDEEIEYLFDPEIPADAQRTPLLQDKKVSWEELETIIGSPPDSLPGEGGTLTYLALKEVGPVTDLEFIPAERLNLITGDNGLGKTFLLECAWWALSGQWTGLPAYPRINSDLEQVQITFEIASKTSRSDRTTISYNSQFVGWLASSNKSRPTIPGLLIYARVDSSFAVWDPERFDPERQELDGERVPRSLVFSKDDVWQGLRSGVYSYSEGLLRDWVRWQAKPDEPPFYIFKQVLRRLSPKDMGTLEPGSPARVPYEAKEIPTLVHPYGVTPITHAAAGIKRIVAIAYFIVWAWSEHQRLSQDHDKEPQRQMVVLIDEMEAHLHPRWQRVILPALLDISKDLSSDLEIQFIIATHSPLVMVSAEPHFSHISDKLFHLYLEHGDMFESRVYLEEIPFTRHGLIDSWLMSEAFELTSSRSLEAEAAIEKAMALQRQTHPEPEEVRLVSQALLHLLAPDDEFWPLWKYFAERYGVT